MATKFPDWKIVASEIFDCLPFQIPLERSLDDVSKTDQELLDAMLLYSTLINRPLVVTAARRAPVSAVGNGVGHPVVAA